MPSNWILKGGDRGSTGGLSESIALEDRAAEAHLQEGEDFKVNRSRPRYHEFNFTAHQGFDLPEHKFVVASAGVAGASVEASCLRSKSLVDQPRLAAGLLSKRALDFSVNLVVESGHGGEHGRLEKPTIFSYLEWVSLEVSDNAAGHQSQSYHALFKRVRVRKIRDHFALLIDGDSGFAGLNDGQDVSVSQLHSLGVTSRTRGVTKDIVV